MCDSIGLGRSIAVSVVSAPWAQLSDDDSAPCSPLPEKFAGWEGVEIPDQIKPVSHFITSIPEAGESMRDEVDLVGS